MDKVKCTKCNTVKDSQNATFRITHGNCDCGGKWERDEKDSYIQDKAKLSKVGQDKSEKVMRMLLECAKQGEGE